MKNLELVLKYFKKHKIRTVFSLIIGFLYVVCVVFIPFLVGLSIDEIVIQITDFSGSFELLFAYILIIVGLVVIGTFTQFIFDVLASIIVEVFIKELKDSTFKKINKLSISYIDQHAHGDLVSRIINDSDNISLALTGCFKQFYEGIVTLLVTIIFMFWINWILGLIVLVLTPFGFLVSYTIAKKSNIHFKKQVAVQGDISSFALENFTNYELVNAFRINEKQFDSFKEVNNRLYKVGQKAQLISSFTNPGTRLINNVVYAIVGFSGALLAILSKDSDFVLLGASCSIGVISTFLQYANQFAKPFNDMSSTISEIQQGFQSLKRINEIFNEKEDIDEGNLEMVSTTKTLNFENLSFGYEKDRLVIKNLNLDIYSGHKIAFIGPTGCGKTTLINLILRFYEPNEGKILIDSTNISQLTKKNLRKKFGLVLQDSWIFKGTIFENIAYAKENATLKEVIEASKKAYSYSFISRLPNGFDTVVSNDSGLSEGEKQLISITRIMLLNPDFIILDEATSNIDSLSETKIVKAVNKLMEGKTSIVIAHRLSTIKNSDLIVALKDGEIIEQGKHDELIKNNGFYKKLYDAQFE